MPIASMARPLSGLPRVIVAARSRPSRIATKYSLLWNFMAKARNSGVAPIRRRIPSVPPTKEAAVVMKSATPARPCCAIG
ncbi:hypothetical protein D3C87_2073310 [compost metagenome]